MKGTELIAITSTPTADFEVLRQSSELEVYKPEDPGYDQARMTWNTARQHRPLAVVFPLSNIGVVEAVDFARAHGVSVAIQATGHGPTREANQALLINMARMDRVEVDPRTQRAVVEGGAKWQAVVDVASPLGLAPLLGSTPDVGAVGYTLGGGLGWLARKCGTSADSTHAFTLVTAAGNIVRASNEENKELFWALRGAGAGHLGVVTSMEIQLYPITAVYGGNLFYPAALAGEVMRRWRDWLPTVPDDLTSAITLMNYPIDPELPTELQGRSFVQVRGAFDGSVDEGEELLAYWRKWKEPELDMFGTLPFDRIAEISADPLEPFPNDGTGLWVDELNDTTIDHLIAATYTGGDEPVFVMTELRHAGGALARGSTEQSAYGNRRAKILMELVSYTPTPETISRARTEIRRMTEAISGDLSGGAYLNYLEGEDRRHGVRQGIGDTAYQRLAALKASFDPDNLFDHGLKVST